MRTLLAIVLLAAGCGGALPRPTDVSAAEAAERWPGTTRADLDHGRSLYQSRCSSCHALVQPSRLSEAKWHEMVAEMAPRAKLREEQREAILRYLVSFSSQPRPRNTATAAPGGAATGTAP